MNALTDVLDGRWAEIRRSLRRQLDDPAFDEAQELDVPAHRERVRTQIAEFARREELFRGFPVEYGGQDDLGGSVVAFEMLGFGDLSLMVKAGVQWGLFAGAVQSLGTRRHHEQWLAGILSLEHFGCFAMTETGHGSDVQHVRTTARYDPETREFLLHTPNVLARKDYIGNAADHGHLAVVFAQLITGEENCGVHAFLVPIRDQAGGPMPGVRIEDCGRKAGLNGVDNGRLLFDQVRIPRTALLNRYGDVAEDGTYSSPIESAGRRFFTMLGTLVRGRISVAGSAGNVTKRALTIAVRYGLTRRQFTRPSGEEVVLLDYLAHQRKLLPALATTYALHFAQEELVTLLHELQGSGGENEVDPTRQRELESRAAGLKAVATWHATSTIQTTREACGGAGYMTENLLPSLKADSDVFTTFEGDNTVLLQLVAKGMLTRYQHQFEDLSPLATARFAAEQFLGTVVERTSARAVVERLMQAVPNRDDDSVLFDRGWQARLFEDREEHVLDGLARRLRASNEDTAFETFNNAQDHVLRAARVHIDRIVLEAFVAAIDGCADVQLRDLLDRVCDLYVLSTIEADRAWFLEHDRMTNARAKAVVAAVNELCQELRPHAGTLVDAFAVPEQFLRAPMLSR